MERTVAWGVAGCGWVVRDFVAPALRDARNARVVALLDPDPAALEAAGRFFPEAKRSTNLRAFLGTPGLQAVYVATPNHLHREVTVAAAGAKKHILCEKPAAPTLGEAREMVRACEAAGVAYATAFDQRFHAAHRRLGEMIRAGDLGEVLSVRIRYACWLPPDWKPDARSEDNWRVDPARAGGGAFFDLAPHGLDLAQNLLGEDLVEAKALFQRRVFDYPVEDGAALVGLFSGGALLTQHVAFNTKETLPRRELEVVGTEGMAVATDTMGQTPGGTLEFVSASDGSRRPVEVPGSDRSPFLNQAETFGEALLCGETFPHPPQRDLHTMRLLEAAKREAQTALARKREKEKVPKRQHKEAKPSKRPTPHGSRVPDDWPREAELEAYLCTNCGFWQKRFARPKTCPVCEDARHVLPEVGYEFWTAEEAGSKVRCAWSEVEEGVWKYGVEPAVGISPSGYVVRTEEGNVAFEGSPFYDEGALEHIASLGGVDFLSASHPHTYGALWRLAERFGPEVALQREDLGWATAFGVTLPFDERLDLPGGLSLVHTGGHFAGHAALYDPRRSILFAGDAVKLELSESDPSGRTAWGISAHKAFVRRVPLTKDELRRYRRVFDALEFRNTFTPFEQCRNVGKKEVLDLLDAQLGGRPFVEVLEL